VTGSFNTIEEAIEDFKQGKMLIVVDDEDRENEGDLLLAAEKVTPEAINFMARYGRGLICVPLTSERINELDLPLMVVNNTDSHDTAFTVSVDAKGTTTGISAFERAATVKKLIDNSAVPEDFKRPGHIFPLKAKDGGVLRRAGHTEAVIDFANLAGMYPAGVICEVMNEDGTMARVPKLREFAIEHGLKIVTIADLIQYRMTKQKLIRRAAETVLPTSFGIFKLIAYENNVDDKIHLAMVKGEINEDKPVLTRVHSECFTGDVLGSLRCDCGTQLAQALKQIDDEGCGVLIYMRQEGRGIGLVNKLKAYYLQDCGRDTVEANEELGFPADLRDYGLGAQILVDLGVRKMRLLTNNPRKIKGLEGYGLTVEERVSIEVVPSTYSHRYLKTKKDKLGHFLENQ